LEDQQQRYERTRARVQAIKGFYIHASVFVVVNIGLFVINALTTGLGGGPWGQDWEERKTREMMDREGGS
jgi:hypothetical protein